MADRSAPVLVAMCGIPFSGKSTVARLVTRLIEPDAGEVIIDGTNSEQDSSDDDYVDEAGADIMESTTMEYF